ncbi:MAG: MFS transporter [Candidatus Hydrogenedentota bacterium]
MYYGWKIVGVSFTTLFISIGFLFYSYGVFFLALEEEFGSSRFGISMGLAFMNITMGVMAPFLGKAVDRYSIRSIMLVGACLMATGFFMAAQITALWQFYVILGTILGLGEAMLGMIPSQTLVANWFIKRRGTALGIATMGVSMSGMVMAPISMALIGYIGWRYTFIVFGLVGLIVVVPMVYFLVYNRPEEKGLYPDGESSPDALPPQGLVHSVASFETEDQKASDAIEHQSWTFRQLVTNGNFWSIVVSIALCMHCIGAILTHMIPMAIDRGLTPTQAAFLLSLSAGVGVIGKVMFGWIADHIDTRIAVWISIAFQATGAFLFTMGDSHTMMQFAAAFFGFGMGGIVPLWGSLIGEVFGRENFGTIMGMMSPCMLPIQITGLPLAGYIYDQTGNYILVLRIFLVIYLCSAIAMFFLGKRDVDQRIKRTLRTKRSEPLQEDSI